MAKSTTLQIPPYAAQVWTDDRQIYLNLGGYIQAYPLTEGGLSKALYLMRQAYLRTKPATLPTFKLRDPAGLVRRFERGKEVVRATEAQKDRALEVLQGLGMLVKT